MVISRLNNTTSVYVLTETGYQRTTASEKDHLDREYPLQISMIPLSHQEFEEPQIQFSKPFTHMHVNMILSRERYSVIGWRQCR